MGAKTLGGITKVIKSYEGRSLWENNIIYIMKIIWRDFKKIRSSRFGDIQESAKSLNSEWSCTYTGGEKTG